MKVEVYCITDKDKPEIIPQDEWIEEGKVYEVEHVYQSTHPKTKGITMFKLKGVDISKYGFGGFRYSRFMMTAENLLKLQELTKICTELNDVDLVEMINE